MTRSSVSVSLLLFLLAAPLAALAIVESDTGTEYPDTVTMTIGDESYDLVVTGVGLREKTFLKVDVYTIVSYVSEEAELGEDAGVELCGLDAPKRIQMDLRRGFSREKLLGAFSEVIKKNYDDLSPFADDMAVFEAYFDRDAQENDRIVFEYAPGSGLVTTLNGEVRGTIDNKAFVEALWTVWFGKKPASGGLKKDLLSAL